MMLNCDANKTALYQGFTPPSIMFRPFRTWFHIAFGNQTTEW